MFVPNSNIGIDLSLDKKGKTSKSGSRSDYNVGSVPHLLHTALLNNIGTQVNNEALDIGAVSNTAPTDGDFEARYAFFMARNKQVVQMDIGNLIKQMGILRNCVPRSGDILYVVELPKAYSALEDTKLLKSFMHVLPSIARYELLAQKDLIRVTYESWNIQGLQMAPVSILAYKIA